METIATLGLLGVYGLLCSIAGGVTGTLLAQRMYARLVRRVDVEVEARATTTRLIAPVDIALNITTPSQATVMIPVETEIVAAPTRGAEMTARILAEAPQIGPRGLSRIFECSTATAQDWYVKSLKIAGRSTGTEIEPTTETPA